MNSKTETTLKLFNKAAEHLLAQNARAVQVNEQHNESCVYRAPEGLKCAIGALIDDEHYDERLEQQTCGDKDVQKAVALSQGVRVEDVHWPLLGRLQQIHDSSSIEIYQWPDRIYVLREQYIDKGDDIDYC